MLQARVLEKEQAPMSADAVRPVKRALLSVFDKTGLAELGQALAVRGVTLLSTGGSARTLREAGLAVVDIADVTGFPEMMDGRVKTLHPKIHGGFLALRDHPEHAAAMAAYGIEGIDLLVSNLYPFEMTVARSGDFDEIVENIDIGGPAMIRAAAKNHGFVSVLTDPSEYESFLAELDETGGIAGRTRRALAARAYARTAAYDAAISGWYETWRAAHDGETAPPARVTVSGTLAQSLRYGENPHQSAAFYVTGNRRPGVATATQVQGKELSYNNINDTSAAYELIAEFGRETPAVVIVKHANPCGVALGSSLKDAYVKAFDCDRVSAFGGIVALNAVLDGETAEEIAKIFTEVIIAPGADQDALRVLSAKKTLRLLIADGLPDPLAPDRMIAPVAGGFLVQGRDNRRVTAADLKVVTKRAPSGSELADMLFAFTVAKHVKSNAIVYAKDRSTAGIGAGQMNRRESARIGAWKAKDAAMEAGWPAPRTLGSAVASDAFFPFPDGLLQAAEAGASCVIQPGGSIRDEDVIRAADEAGLAMVFTGVRHFKH
jgi:phosphoribosylaminoimidazolecarboxamide formyltransferase/IMP cyclohydrolase